MSRSGSGDEVAIHDRGTESWQRFADDITALGGTGDVHMRRRTVLLRLLAAGLPLSAVELMLPGWDAYLEPTDDLPDPHPRIAS